jgi:hypothetical protein
MATQPIFHDAPQTILLPTAAEPPTAKYTAVHADENGHGCSICASIVRAEGDEISIQLPSVPAKLEVMVIDASGDEQYRYAPTESAMRALVLSKRAIWRLPDGAPVPSTVVVSFGFDQDGTMVAEDRQAATLVSGRRPLTDLVPHAGE